MSLPLETRLKLALSRMKRSSKTAPYPQSVRKLAVAFALERRAEGESWSQIADASGLTTASLQSWCEAQRLESKERVSVVPVELSSRPASPPVTGACDAVTIVSPRGFHLTGLSVEAAIRAIGELG